MGGDPTTNLNNRLPDTKQESYYAPLNGAEENYENSVLKHPETIEWIEAGKLETGIITADEIET